MSQRLFDNLAAIFHALGWLFLPFCLLPLIVLFFIKNQFFKNLSTALIRIIDMANAAIGETVKWALPVLVLTVAFSVFALSIFGFSSTKLSESAAYLHACVIMLGAGATLLAGQHVRVDIFYARMQPRTRAMIDFSGFYIFLLPVCLIILWNAQSFTALTWKNFEGSIEADGIHGQYWLKTLIPLFAILMISQGLSIALRAVFIIQGLTPPERPAHIPPLFNPREPDL